MRKAAFQIHLWIGLAIGLYVVVLSLTGSALVFRREMDRAFLPARPPFDRSGASELMSGDALRQAARQAYPGHEIVSVTDVSRRNPVVAIEMRQGGAEIERIFNAYTGEDLGDPFPRGAQIVLWLARLHDDLLWEDRGRGRFVNGLGSILVTLLCITGAIVWWPGIRNWRRAATVRWRAAWPRLTFDLHSAFGFWFFLVLAMWAISGIYLSIPGPFLAFNDWWYGEDILIARPGDVFFEWLVRLHFGRWRSHTLKAVWVIVGLIPAVMFVTGAVMWWNRVARPKARGLTRDSVSWGRADTRSGGADVEATLS